MRGVLQAAFLRPVASRPVEAPRTIQQRAIPKAPKVTDADVSAYRDRHAAASDADRMPGSMYVVAARRMMNGMADPSSLCASSDSDVRRLAAQHGVLGHTYLDGDALGGVRQTWAFIRSRKASPDFVLMRSIPASDAAIPEMAEIMKVTKVVRKMPELSAENLGLALERAVSEGRITPEQAANAVSRAASFTTQESLAGAIAHVNLAKPAAVARPADYQPAQAGTFYHGDTSGERLPEALNPESVRRAISHLMNTGLSGKVLQKAILSRYSRADLVSVKSVGSGLAKYDGVQGSYFVDPTAYSDYGRGCKVGGDQFRKLNPVQNVLASSGCTGCSSQTHPGWCSRYAKTLIRQVPAPVIAAAEERRRLPVVVETAPMRNPVTEYGLESSLPVEIASAPKPAPEISIPSQPVQD